MYYVFFKTPLHAYDTCDIDISECASNPCIMGNCDDVIVDLVTSNPTFDLYVCKCDPGYTGVNCQINIDDCTNNGISPCVSGVCQDLVNGFHCACAKGFTGLNCDIEISECDSNPCYENGGICEEKANGVYFCKCNDGFSGKKCDMEIDECGSQPCGYGNCRDSVNKWFCECFTGYTGQKCTVDVDECFVGPCDGSGTLECKDLVGGFILQVFSWWF